MHQPQRNRSKLPLVKVQRIHTLSAQPTSMQSASNGRYPPFYVEMCMAQHSSLWGFLAFTAIGTNVRTSLIPPPAPQKTVFIPPPGHPLRAAGRGFVVGLVQTPC